MNGQSEDNSIEDPNNWDPVKKANNQNIENSNKTADSPRRHGEKKKLTYEEILQLLEEKTQNLMERVDFVTSDARPDLKFIQRQTRYNPDMILNRRIKEHIVKLGIGHIFLKMWKSLGTVDYLLECNAPAFKNLQTVLSIVWNCSDVSVQMCDSFARAGVVQLFLAELAGDKIAGSELDDGDTLYLCKAYLGILHNICRMCSDSRKFFRSGNAVKILEGYLNCSNLLVKAKAYIILSYIINEEENSLINALDENIAFIIEILRDSLREGNHFSKTYAFWASEIVDGLNHLSMNDSNKARFGRLGALPLYIKLMQDGNEEEQNLSTAGLWILAFKEENKQILKTLPGCIEALRSLTANSPQESVRRAARGALRVVRTAPDRPMIRVEDADIPHIMVSYHHNSAQPMMIKIKNRLRAAGFKVWMDVDNMFGSTLESMALAVEKSCAVLISMTQGYKDSPSCRTEAEYTYRQRKSVVPLLLQEGYEPDGWLGALVGTGLHYDFSREEYLVTEMPKLIRELGERGKLPVRQFSLMSSSCDSSMFSPHSSPKNSPRILRSSSSHLNSAQSTPEHTLKMITYSEDNIDRPVSRSSSVRSLHSLGRPSNTMEWSSEHVKAWLEAKGLPTLTDKFSDFNGALLYQFRKMASSAPQHFYHTLESSLDMSLVQQLKYTKAQEELQFY